jgi:transmembrane 9 superfamily protein 3
MNIMRVGSIGQLDQSTDPPTYKVFTRKDFDIRYNNDRIVHVKMNNTKPVVLDFSPGQLHPYTSLNFTYTVNWIPTNQSYETRFKQYLDTDFFQHQIHWFSIMNSFAMVFFLTAIVSIILYRTLRKDMNRYEREDSLLDFEKDFNDDYGWKLIYGDVFRPPPNLILFSAMNGTGTHLCLLALTVITYTIFGDLYIYSGTILTASIFLYALCSFVSGYYSASLYAKYGGKQWIRTMMISAGLWPGIVSLSAFAINLVAISYQSARAIPFRTMVAVIAIWFFIVFPLTILGSILGRKWAARANFPCRVNSIPRPIPDKRW